MSFHLSGVHLSVVRLQDQWGADTKARSKKPEFYTESCRQKPGRRLIIGCGWHLFEVLQCGKPKEQGT